MPAINLDQVRKSFDEMGFSGNAQDWKIVNAQSYAKTRVLLIMHLEGARAKWLPDLLAEIGPDVSSLNCLRLQGLIEALELRRLGFD